MDVERPRALADEVSGRLEPRPCVHAAAREQRHAVGVEVPGDGLGDVARLLVLREQADERAAEIHVQRREDEWERRLGDTRVRRKVVRERTEAVARGERVDEAGERGDCVVHAAGGIRIPPGDRSRVCASAR